MHGRRITLEVRKIDVQRRGSPDGHQKKTQRRSEGHVWHSENNTAKKKRGEGRVRPTNSSREAEKREAPDAHGKRRGESKASVKNTAPKGRARGVQGNSQGTPVASCP